MFLVEVFCDTFLVNIHSEGNRALLYCYLLFFCCPGPGPGVSCIMYLDNKQHWGIRSHGVQTQFASWTLFHRGSKKLSVSSYLNLLRNYWKHFSDKHFMTLVGTNELGAVSYTGWGDHSVGAKLLTRYIDNKKNSLNIILLSLYLVEWSLRFIWKVLKNTVYCHKWQFQASVYSLVFGIFWQMAVSWGVVDLCANKESNNN